MTQLGELQRALPRFRKAGVKLYAVSYDEVDGLAAFARAQGIGFPLLSDADSSVIRRFGILNTHIDQGEALFYGIPFPGTYVVDENGIVTEKFFSRHVATRESPEAMIDSALGRILLQDDEPSATGGDDDVRVTAALHGGGGVFTGSSQRHIVVRFELREGLHIYGEPIPEGMLATRIEVAGPPGLVVGDPVYPPSEPLHLAELGVDLHVWSGVVDVIVPVYANSHLAPMLETPKQSVAELTVSVRYQACDARTCLVPRTERLTLEAGIGAYTVPRIGPFAGSGQRFAGHDAGHHMLRLVRRGARRQPLRALKLLGSLAAQRIRRALR